MKPYRVTYRYAVMRDDEEPFAFDCQADDAAHACEQCLDAEPEAIALIATPIEA